MLIIWWPFLLELLVVWIHQSWSLRTNQILIDFYCPWIFHTKKWNVRWWIHFDDEKIHAQNSEWYFKMLFHRLWAIENEMPEIAMANSISGTSAIWFLSSISPTLVKWCHKSPLFQIYWHKYVFLHHFFCPRSPITKLICFMSLTFFPHIVAF